MVQVYFRLRDSSSSAERTGPPELKKYKLYDNAVSRSCVNEKTERTGPPELKKYKLYDNAVSRSCVNVNDILKCELGPIEAIILLVSPDTERVNCLTDTDNRVMSMTYECSHGQYQLI